MGVCNCVLFCCTLLYVHSSIAIILMEKRELVALLNLSSLCLVMVEWLFLAVPWGCLRFVIVVFPDHTHLLFPMKCSALNADFIEKILSTALHVNVVALKAPNTSFSYAHCMQKVEEICQYDWKTILLINSYME